LFKKISIVIGIFSLLLFLSTTTAVASLSNATVEVSPLETGVPVQYTIGFYVGSSGALEGGRDEIILYFPEGTVFPDSLRNNLSAGSVFVNGVEVDDRSLYHNDTRLIITLPSAVNVRANGYVGIIITPEAGIKLPRMAGTHYVEVETSREQKTKTNSFTIDGSRVSNLEVIATSSAVDEFAEYEISFRTSSRGELVSEEDEIYIEFDKDFYLPRSIVGSDIEVNGVKVRSDGVKVDLATNTLEILVPAEVRIDDRDTVTVKIDSRAGIRNPRQTGSYRFQVYTSADTLSTWVNYRVGMAITTPVVVINPNEGGKDSQYTIGFTTSKEGALQAGKGQIYLEFPDGTYIPRSISTKYVTINGQNAEDVDTTPRDNMITITVPSKARIAEETYVNIVIKSEAGIENPDVSGEYRISINTTADKNKVRSNSYTIVGIAEEPDEDNDEVSSKPTVRLSSYKPGDRISLDISFEEGLLGNLRGGDKLHLIFPAAYEISGKIEPEYVTVNGEEAEKLELIGQSLVVTLPDDVDFSDYNITEVKIGSQVGIKNPDKEASYSLLLCSSINSSQIYNCSVKISETVVENDGEKPSVELTATEVGEDSGYLIFFKNTGSETMLEGDTISLTFPVGTEVPENLSRSFIRINGQTPEKVKVSSNKVTLTLPEGLLIKEDAIITVLIEETAEIKNPKKDGRYSLVVQTSTGYFAMSAEYLVGEAEPGDENEVDRKDGEIVFKIDSKIAYYGKTQVNLDTAPTILENFTVVPLRALGDALGAETQYEDATRTVTVKYQDKEIVFYIDSKLVKVNNEWKVIDIAATLINNRVMIPARFVSESFGAAVVWVAETREVIITK
jgi:phage baseplate assembly protein gpV